MAGLYARPVGAPDGVAIVSPTPAPRKPAVPARFTPEFSLSLPVLSRRAAVARRRGRRLRRGRPVTASGADRPAFAPSAVWSVPAGGGEARRLTYGRSDSAPRWSPDGRWLAFLSDREKDGLRQVHLLPRDGGEAPS